MEKHVHENRLEEYVKKSKLNAKNQFDYEKLIYPTRGLLPSSYKEELEEILFIYNVEGMVPVKELHKESKQNQYQFLINFAGLEPLIRTYKIPFTPDNIYYDENYCPYIKHRDIYPKGEIYEEGEFLKNYKTFVGGILGKKYSVEQIQESGLEILKSEEGFREYQETTSGAQMADKLRIRRSDFLKKQNETTVRVSRGGYRVKSMLAVLSTLLLAVCVTGLGYLAWKVVPYQEQIIAANEGYVVSDYIACIDSLKSIEPEEMSESTKYILAVSYAKSESLKQEEIQGIVSRLSPSSNEKELEYWIYLGRLQSQKAENTAKALSDDKLLMYAYMKELNQLESNNQLEGEEKAARIKQLESDITTLGNKYNIEENTETTEGAVDTEE